MDTDLSFTLSPPFPSRSEHIVEHALTIHITLLTRTIAHSNNANSTCRTARPSCWSPPTQRPVEDQPPSTRCVFTHARMHLPCAYSVQQLLQIRVDFAVLLVHVVHVVPLERGRAAAQPPALLLMKKSGRSEHEQKKHQNNTSHAGHGHVPARTLSRRPSP